MSTALEPQDMEEREAQALDAYSRVVVDVAERLAPSVANLRVMRRARGGGGQVPAGAGSAVALTPDGFLLTSAHVVAGPGRTGRASFVDGRELRFRVIGVDRLTDLARDAEGDAFLVQAFAAHAKALCASDAKGLGAVAALFESLGADLLAAEAWTEASAVSRSKGHGDEALTATARAETSLDRCEGARTPALVPQTILAPTLTPRQRDVAALVAGGLSNREVADTLYVSLRTVENHLYQVYAKLAVSDRKGLARRLNADTDGSPEVEASTSPWSRPTSFGRLAHGDQQHEEGLAEVLMPPGFVRHPRRRTRLPQPPHAETVVSQ